jgi:hypothetical protein
MRQRRWLEFIKDYNLEVHYHPGKANVMADALSQKSQCNCLSVKPLIVTLCQEMERLNLGIIQHGTLSNLVLESTIQSQIIEAQKVNKGIAHIKEQVEAGKATCFRIDEKGVLWFKHRLVVPKVLELHQQILDEAHLSRYSIHPGSSKIYQDLKKRFWWTKMKIEIARYVAKCDICQRVKAVHLKYVGPLQPLPIPASKWEDISMDFIVGLPKTSKGYDSIRVIVDRLTKLAHFLPVNKSKSILAYCNTLNLGV